MENQEVNLIQEVDDQLYLNTPTKENHNSSHEGFSTPDDGKKEIDFKINISRIQNPKRSFEDYKSSPSASINKILDKTSGDICGILKSSLSSNEFLPMDVEELCGYHQKPLDVVCIRDLTLICSNCALFGVHKGHDFKSLIEVNRDKSKIRIGIENIIQNKHEIQDTLRNGNDQEQDLAKVYERKQALIATARSQYQKLRQIIDASQNQVLQQIQQQALITQQRIQNQNKLLLKPFTTYHTWEHKAIRYLECLQSQDRFQEQIVMLNYDKSSKNDIVNEGSQIISNINKNIQKIKQNKTNAIMQLEVLVDPTLPSKIKNFVTLPSFKSLSHKIIKSTSTGSILVESKRNSYNRKSIILDQQFLDIKKPYSTINQRKPSYSKLDRSMNKRNSIRSPQYSPNNSSRRLDSREKKYRHTDYKMNQKYTKVYDSILNDTTQIVELMHGEFPNKAVVQILRLLPDRPKIKVLKLNGNRLTDEIAPELWNSLRYVSNLNLSGNQLTDGFVASMTANISSIRGLRTIVLSQNKINARNVKSMIEEVRRLGVTVSI